MLGLGVKRTRSARWSPPPHTAHATAAPLDACCATGRTWPWGSLRSRTLAHDRSVRMRRESTQPCADCAMGMRTT